MISKKTFSGVIVWSVISAAFIGPGTVTTAATAGSMYQLDLLWAVAFATVACILLQEISARLTIISGLTMGQALDRKYGEKHALFLKYLLGGPVVSPLMMVRRADISCKRIQATVANATAHNRSS